MKHSNASGPARDTGEPSFYTAAETARLFRLDESTLYRHLRSGTFPGLKIGGRYVVPRQVVDRLVADILATGKCVALGEWTARRTTLERDDLEDPATAPPGAGDQR